MALTIKFETTGDNRSGISGAGKEYHMCEAFAHVEGARYPIRFEYYCAKANEVLPVGFYEGDIKVSSKDNRLSFEVDPRQARRISNPAAASIAPQASKPAAGSAA